MSDAAETSALLGHLKADRETGCLTIQSASLGVCQVYLFFGKVFHASGPSGEGDGALAEALTWPEVTLSFDEKAKLPSQQTIIADPLPLASSASDIEASSGAKNAPTLSNNRRIAVANLAYIGDGCLFYFVIFAILAAVIVSKALGWSTDWVPPVALTLVPALGLLWLVLYFRYRYMYRRAVLEVPGGVAKSDIPRIIDSPAAVNGGAPELVMKLPTRCLLGRMGKCRVELYPAGLQVWKGQKHPQPRWQFLYNDLLQAESLIMSGSGTRNSRDQYFLRLIADRPRMAFLFGGSFTDDDTQRLLSSLNQHGVRTFIDS